MNTPKCCLVTTDDLGNKVVFYEENRLKHAKKHRELRDLNFVNNNVKQAINSPDGGVYQSLRDKKCHCYYLEEFKVIKENKTITQYTKVIVLTTASPKNPATPYIIKSVFRPQIIKERVRIR